MPKLSDFNRKLLKHLNEAGCECVRQANRGGHDTWHSPITNRNFTVNNPVKSRYTANEILKQAGIHAKL